jgi:hypothetical protein
MERSTRVIRRGPNDTEGLFSASAGEFVVGESACHGDSGGAALSVRTGELLGVLSRGAGGDGTLDNLASDCVGASAEGLVVGISEVRATVDAALAAGRADLQSDRRPPVVRELDLTHIVVRCDQRDPGGGHHNVTRPGDAATDLSRPRAAQHLLRRGALEEERCHDDNGPCLRVGPSGIAWHSPETWRHSCWFSHVRLLRKKLVSPAQRLARSKLQGT